VEAVVLIVEEPLELVVQAVEVMALQQRQGQTEVQTQEAVLAVVVAQVQQQAAQAALES
jgi:hypothetical protein